MSRRFSATPLAREIGGAQCVYCKHYHIGNYPRKCDAFPEKIPRAIVLGNHDHYEPFDGDGGILFEQLSKEEMEDRMQKLDESIAEHDKQDFPVELAMAK